MRGVEQGTREQFEGWTGLGTAAALAPEASFPKYRASRGVETVTVVGDETPIPIAPRVVVELVRTGEPAFYAGPVREATDVFRMFRTHASAWDREHFFTVALDTKHRVVGVEHTATGTLAACLVHPREVLKSLILQNASAFITVHNHPSGDATPSSEDIKLTKRLQEAARLVGITYLDHVVVTGSTHASIRPENVA